LLQGPSGEINVSANPTIWINDTTWADIYRNIYGAAKLEKLKGFETFFFDNID